MHKKKTKILLLLVLLAIIFSVFATSFATSDEIKKYQRKIDEITESLESLRQEQEQNQTLQNQTANKMVNTEIEISDIEDSIAVIEDEIEVSEINIDIKEKEQEITQIHIDNKNDILESRLRVMYKTGEVGYMEVLLGSEDFVDLLTRVDMIQYIVNHDQDLIVELEDLEKLIEQQTLSLNRKKDELNGVKEEKEIAQTQLEDKLYELAIYKRQLETDMAGMQELDDQMVESSNELTQVLKNLELSAKYVGGKLGWPLRYDFDLSDSFGMRTHPVYGTQKMHTGIDIPTDLNADILAANDGVVIYSNWYGGYGKLVMIDHGGGIVTFYGHNNGLIAEVGQKVARGDVIAKAGTTGVSTGVHCHFEVRLNGDYVDPFNYLNQ